MKLPLTLFPLLLLLQLNAQESFFGQYYGYEEQLNIKKDSIFFIKDMRDRATWAEGSWSLNKDTNFLKFVPVYDTLISKSGDGEILSTELVLSADTISNTIYHNKKDPEVIDSKDFEMISGQLTQDRNIIPQKLLIRKNRLFEFDNNGAPIRKEVRSMKFNKKVKPGYTKMKNRKS